MANDKRGVGGKFGKKTDKPKMELAVVEKLAKEVMGAVDPATRQLMDRKDPDKMTLREQQKTAVSYLSKMVCHPLFRDKYTEWALENPGEAMRQALSTHPKELLVESHSVQEKIITMKIADPASWQHHADAIKSGEIVDVDVVKDDDERE